MKKYCILLALFSITLGHTQNTDLVQKEINQSLWKPFKAAFEDLDAEKLNALYAKEVLRVTPSGIDTENNFRKANIERLKAHKLSNTELQLDFWLDSRHSNETTSYEVGFYRMTLTKANTNDTIYGQFHIVLKKVDGLWKINQDWDTGKINGKEISRQDFEKQKPIQFD